MASLVNGDVQLDIAGNTFLIDLGEDARKAQEQFEKYSSLVFTTKTKDLADAALESSAMKTKALVSEMIDSIEETVGMVAEQGIKKLYDSLGINETSINTAKTIVSMADNAAALATDILTKGVVALNKYSEMSLPLDVRSAIINMFMTMADLLYKTYIEAYQQYIDLLIGFILDPGATFDALMTALTALLDQIVEQLADDICQQYLGMSFKELMNLVQVGINYYKQYKKLREEWRKRKSEDNSVENTDGEVNAVGNKYGIQIDMQITPELMKQNLLDWLASQSDLLYNGFLIVQIRDAVYSIKDTIRSLTDIDLETLAEGINTLDDFIELLDELGLGDKSLSVNLDMIPTLGLNAIYSGLNSLTDSLNSLTDLATIGMNAVDVNVKTTKKQLYEIKTDGEKKEITVKFYTNPTKRSVANKIYKIFSKAKDNTDKALFTPSECKSIQDTISALYKANETSGKGTSSVKTTKYEVKIELDIDVKEDNKRQNAEQQNNSNSDIPNGEATSSPKGDVELTVLEEVGVSEQGVEKRKGNRKMTISVLHDVFTILKMLVPQMKLLATLISNYKTNKAYERQMCKDSMYQIFMEVMDKLGFNKRKSVGLGGYNNNGDYVVDDSAIYTVRTYPLYVYLKDEIKVISSSDIAFNIDKATARKINTWLDRYDKDAEKVSVTQDVMLFIDKVSINGYLECMKKEQQKLEGMMSSELATYFASCKASHQNGTYDNLENGEMVGDKFVYSDKNLPRMMSQILMAQYRGANVDE